LSETVLDERSGGKRYTKCVMVCVQTTFVAEPFVTVLEDKKVPETRCVLTASA
jgi:hypothetical protein